MMMMILSKQEAVESSARVVICVTVSAEMTMVVDKVIVSILIVVVFILSPSF